MSETPTLSEFLKKHGPEMARRIERMAEPAFRPGKEWDPRLSRLKRALLPAQGDAVMGLSRLLKRRRSVNVVAEMGVGKTIIALAITWLHHRPARVLVMCPSHLTGKWRREIMETIPGAKVEIIKSLADLSRLDPRSKPEGWEYFVVSKEKAKLGYAWRPVVKNRHGAPLCPRCQTVVTDHVGDVASPTWLRRAKRFCQHCGEPLWSADGGRFRRFPLAKYIQRKLNGFFDFFVADECHQYKAESAQGAAYGLLAAACEKTISLTGTLAGGYADDLFLLIARTDLASLDRRGLGFHDSKKFMEIYGKTERITKEKWDPEDNACSLGHKTYTRARRLPGIGPLVFSDFLSRSSAFLRLADVAPDLPPLDEFTHAVDMTDEQRKLYERLEEDLGSAMRKASGRVLGSFINTLLAWPDKPYGFDPVEVPEESIFITVPALPEARDGAARLPKEDKLLEIVEEEIQAGRNVFVFCAYTGKHDVAGRVADLLRRNGVATTVLSAKVKPEKREKWLDDQVKKGTRVVVGNPRLVETGLDLLEFPTLVFMQTGYSVYTLRQASRRSWRIGQERPVRVHYLYYGGTLQDKALALMGSKLEASLALEGDFSEDGLAALAGGEDMTTMLARAVAGEIRVETVEDAWSKIARRPTKGKVIPLPVRPKESSTPPFPPKQSVKPVQLSLFG